MSCLKLTYQDDLKGIFSFHRKNTMDESPVYQISDVKGNHLGNVLTVISDLKIPESDDSENVSSWSVGIRSTSDYSPFGVQLDGRTSVNEGYRYGYNGMEGDNEIKGNGNSYTTEFRQYDPRLGRWLSIDPLAAKFPAWSSYAFCNDNPIIFIDPDGRESKHADGSEDPSGPTKKEMKSIKKEVDRILKDSKRLSKQEYRTAKSYQKEHGGEIKDWTDSDGNQRYSVQSTSNLEDGTVQVSNKVFNRSGWTQIQNRKTIVVSNFTNMFSFGAFHWAGPIDVIGVSGGSSYTHGVFNMRVYSNYTSILFITRGPDFGLWKATTKGEKYGLHYEYSANIVVGKYWGGDMELRASTLAGSGWEAGVDLAGGVSLWGSFKGDTWIPGWTGASVGVGPAAGGSVGPTYTTIRRY